MALPVWQATIVTGEVNDGGNIIPSAVITVILEKTGLHATLFSDRAGVTSLGAGGTFTADVNGFAQFFVAPGDYRITATDAGTGFSKTWRFVTLYIAQETADDMISGHGLVTDSIDGDGNVWGDANITNGSNANGEFWKYPNGNLFMRGSAQEDGTINIPIGGSLQYTLQTPTDFVSGGFDATGTFTDQFGSSQPVIINRLGSDGEVIIYNLGTSAITRMVPIQYLFIGRWK